MGKLPRGFLKDIFVDDMAGVGAISCHISS
jgi:hypothetical protein